MHATIRRYDGIDQSRTAELVERVNETLVPKLNEVPGFAGYYLVDAGKGVLSSLVLFETDEQGREAGSLVERWIREEKLETMIPNKPTVTSGEVVAHGNGIRV